MAVFLKPCFSSNKDNDESGVKEEELGGWMGDGRMCCAPSAGSGNVCRGGHDVQGVTWCAGCDMVCITCIVMHGEVHCVMVGLGEGH